MSSRSDKYKNILDIPKTIALFPLKGALLLPGGNLPLNIFEPRYISMIDDTIGNDRLIGMIQPAQSDAGLNEEPTLNDIGCIGRITAFQETDDGHYLINLKGICRFHIEKEVINKSDSTGGQNEYRRANIVPFLSDLKSSEGEIIDRNLLISTFKRFLAANNMETDWNVIEKTDDESLVTALCMMSPYGSAEKQALLEAEDLKSRADTLVALTEIALAKNPQDPDSVLQ